MNNKVYYVYILTNISNSVMYVEVTNNLERRTFEHKNHANECFTSRYNATRLMYFEEFYDVQEAIAREKQLKHWSRKKKANLINMNNPMWKDLFKY